MINFTSEIDKKLIFLFFFAEKVCIIKIMLYLCTTKKKKKSNQKIKIMKTYEMRLSADLPVMKVMVKNGAEFERLILRGSSMRQIQIFVNDEDFKTLTTFAKRHCENYWGTFNHKLGRASWCYECQHHTQGLAVHCAGGQKYITIVAWRPYGAEWSRVGAPDRKWVK